MESKSFVPLLLVAGIVVVVFLLIQKRQALAAAQSVQPSGYVAVANTVNSKVDKITGWIPWVGDNIDNAIAGPVRNVTTGNYTAMLGSAITGGASDQWSSVNPLNWF